jgi:hypothetical protein
MANEKMTDFRKKRNNDFTKGKAKEAMANVELLHQRIETLTKLVFGLSGKLFEMEKKVRNVTRDANAAQWRSQAIVEVLAGFLHLTDSDGNLVYPRGLISETAEKLQIREFEKDAAEFDRVNDLLPFDGTAAMGHFAVVQMDYYKDGTRMEDQRTVRSKIHLGQHELFPELDELIVGMRVGETKKCPLNLMGLTDEVEILLLDLKQPKPKEEPIHEPVKS